MEKPLVSVVMATFNEPVEYITASIESILNQTYNHFELIVVDDSTHADTISVIDAFAKKDKRVVIIRHKERMGFVVALNEGLRSAKGQYIARMDGDDIAMKERLQIQINYLNQIHNVDILGGAMNIIDSEGKIISYRYYPQRGVKLLFWSMLRNPLAHPTVMFRTSIVKAGFYYNVEQKKAEDLEFWLRLKRNGYRWENMTDILLNYRVDQDLSLKRNREQWQYNYKARKKNFTWTSPFFSMFSILISGIYVIMPTNIVRYIYSRENSKRSCVLVE